MQSLKKYVNKVKNNMKKLGIYKAEFDDIILIYANLLMMHDQLLNEFFEGGSVVETETMAGNLKKNPILSSLENIRKDIITYSDRLGLNAKSYDAMDIKQEKVSKLEIFLKNANLNDKA